jgi:hypothetical protein
MKIETKGNPLSFPPKLKNPYPNFPKKLNKRVREIEIELP